MSTTKNVPQSPASCVAPEGSIPVPDGAKYLPGFACWVFERDGQLWSTFEWHDFPGVWFIENEGCVDDPGAADDDWLAAANAALGADYVPPAEA